MPYTNGRGFANDDETQQALKTLSSHIDDKPRSFGLQEFWKGRPELGAGNAYNTNWLELNRPAMERGPKKMEATLPSPFRPIERVNAMRKLGPEGYNQWNKQVGNSMNWLGRSQGLDLTDPSQPTVSRNRASQFDTLVDPRKIRGMSTGATSEEETPTTPSAPSPSFGMRSDAGYGVQGSAESAPLLPPAPTLPPAAPRPFFGQSSDTTYGAQ
jgi:hypothetical protein